MTTITYTEFPCPQAHKALQKNEHTIGWADFCEMVFSVPSYAQKSEQPLIKLAAFDCKRTQAHSLRHDANLLQIWGLEGDYDQGVVGIDQAQKLLERAGVRAVLHTSASHTQEAPRWRVLAPLSTAHTSAKRTALMARLNGVLGGILSSESWTLSQAYYLGRVDGVSYEAVVTFDDPDEGGCIDTLDELDALAIGKPVATGGKPSGAGASGGVSLGVDMFADKVQALGRKLRTGDGRREMLKSYLASRSARGLLESELIKLVESVINEYFDPSDPIDPANILQMIRSFASKDAANAAQPFNVDLSGFLGGLGEAPTADVSNVIDLAEARAAAESDEYEPSPPPPITSKPPPIEAAAELVRWIDGYGEDSHRLVSIAAAMAVICAAAGRRYVASSGDPASDYIAVIAPSVSMARYALGACEQVFNEAGFRPMLRTQRFSNVGQVYGALHKSPALLALSDDLGEMQKYAKRQPSGLTEQTLSLLTGRVHGGDTMCLDSWADLGFGVKQPEGGAETPVIYAPALTWLSIVGAQHLSGLFGSGEFARGSVDSILLVPATDITDWMQRPRVARPSVPKGILTRIRNMRGFEDGETIGLTADRIFNGTACVEPSPCVVDFPPLVGEIEALWISMYATRGQQARQLARGARGHLRRWVTALAAFACPDDPIATTEIIMWCSEIIGSLLDSAIDAANLRAADDDVKPDAYQRVLEFVGERGADGASLRTITNGCRAYRALASDKRSELMALMLSDNAIVEMSTPSGRGTVFLLAQHAKRAKKGGVK